MGSRLTFALFAFGVAAACAGPGALTRDQNSELPLARFASSESGDSSQSQSSNASSQSQSSEGSSASSASAESTNAGSTGEGIGNTLNSRYPSSVESSEASRPSSEQSSASTANSENSSENSTQESSQTQSQTNLAPVFSTAGLTTTAGAVGLIIWLATRPSPEAAEAAVTFLRANQFQLQEDLAFGAGRSVDDLASLARIRPENRGRFASLLFANRKELLDLADARLLTPDRAVRTLRRMGELAELDPVLRQDGERALAELRARR